MVSVALGVATVAVAFYRLVLLPLADVSKAMKRFTSGDSSTRAGSSAASEVANAAKSFNQMADAITGEHTRVIAWLSGVAARLRDPIGVMRTAIDELSPPHKTPTEAMLRTKLHVLDGAAGRLTCMIEEFLDECHLEWERISLKPEDRDIRDLLQEVVEMYDTYSSFHEIVLSLPDAAVFVRVNPTRLTQVFNTLVSNALESTPSGGVVEIGMTADGAQITVTVRDHGAGVPQEELDQAFKPFGGSTSRRQPGRPQAVTLSVARRIVGAHGGRLEAESKPKEGSTFRVRLPVSRDRLPGHPPPLH